MVMSRRNPPMEVVGRCRCGTHTTQRCPHAMYAYTTLPPACYTGVPCAAFSNSNQIFGWIDFDWQFICFFLIIQFRTTNITDPSLNNNSNNPIIRERLNRQRKMDELFCPNWIWIITSIRKTTHPVTKAVIECIEKLNLVNSFLQIFMMLRKYCYFDDPYSHTLTRGEDWKHTSFMFVGFYYSHELICW